jgi:hypothetical protein
MDLERTLGERVEIAARRCCLVSLELRLHGIEMDYEGHQHADGRWETEVFLRMGAEGEVRGC